MDTINTMYRVKKHPRVAYQETYSAFPFESDASVNFNEKGFDNDCFLSLSAAMRNFCLQYDKNSRGRQNGEIHSQPDYC
jgi:hypothetical protein